MNARNQLWSNTEHFPQTLIFFSLNLQTDFLDPSYANYEFAKISVKHRNIFSIRFFQCILEVLVHLYWCAKVFYDPSFRRVVKKKNRFRPKTAFFTQLLSRHALTIHFTDTPFLLKHLAFVLPIPTVPLNFLHHA